MLPSEFYEQLARIRDHELANPQPVTAKGRVKTLFFVSLLLAFISVFLYFAFQQHIQPWISWIIAVFS